MEIPVKGQSGYLKSTMLGRQLGDPLAKPSDHGSESLPAGGDSTG